MFNYHALADKNCYFSMILREINRDDVCEGDTIETNDNGEVLWEISMVLYYAMCIEG